MPRPTRVLFLSDNHSGHRGGLTPPGIGRSREWDRLMGEDWSRLQRAAWTWYRQTIRALQPIDVACHCGDAIDGKGARNGGVELITADLDEQAEIAIAALQIVRPKRGWHMVYGTHYHTASEAGDADRKVAEALGTELHNHQWVDVDGCTFDLKHHIGGSNSVNGGDAALRNEINQARAWHIEHGWPLCQWLIRGHVHRHRTVDCCQTLPGLQLWTQYGGRRCSGIVHFGLVWCDIEGGHVTWHDDKRLLAALAPALAKA